MYTIQRRLPLNFAESDHELFAHELEVSFQTGTIHQLENIAVDPYGHLWQQSSILPLTYVDQTPQRRDQKRALKARLERFFAGKINMEGSFIWCTDNWSHMYFHWLTDALPRLMRVKHMLSQHHLLLPSVLEDISFVSASLAPFRATEVKYGHKKKWINVPELIVPAHTAPTGNYHEPTIRSLGEFMRHYFSKAAPPFREERIYISRAQARHRKVLNEDEVIALMSKYNFHTVLFEEFSWPEQVRICLQARYMASIHGAGLTNMLFMQPGAKVLELRKIGDQANNCFFSLASALRHDYYYQTCEGDKADAHAADLTVDLDQLEKNINLMLET